MLDLNKEIVRQLKAIAFFLMADKTDKSNAFKASSFQRAAVVIENLTTPITDIEWKKLPRIGKSLAEEIDAIIKTGTSPRYQKMGKKSPPSSIMNLTKIPGIGTHKATHLYEVYKITSIEGLEKKIKAGKIKDPKIISGYESWIRGGRGKRLLLYQVLEAINPYILKIRNIPGVLKATVAGSIRRRKDTVGDIDVVVCVDSKIDFKDFKKSLPFDIENIEGKTKLSIPLQVGGMEKTIDLRLTRKRNYGACMNHMTGSQKFNEALRTMAKAKGLRINEYGYFDRTRYIEEDKTHNYKHAYLGGDKEETLFELLGIPFVPPIYRTGPEAIGKKFVLKDWDNVISGCLHTHTEATTHGTISVEDLIIRAKEEGFSFIGIADHIKEQSVALAMIKNIRELSAKEKEIKVFVGADCNIHEGSFDLRPEVLKKFDYMVLSVHPNHFAATEQICAAMKQAPIPAILSRVTQPEKLNWKTIFTTAARYGILIEINSTPDKIGPTVEQITLAKSCGCRFILGSDSLTGIWNHLKYGFWHMQKCKLLYRDLVNTKFEDILTFLGE